MKCDLHVHTIHSGMCTVPFFRRFARECYSEPEAVYEKLKSLGMDLVTVTDHDSIDAAETLRRHPDFFVSEEVTCCMPSGTEAHIGVYDISEKQHIQIQRRRHDLPSLLAYFREQEIVYCLNHPFSTLTGSREEADFTWFESMFPTIETRNGHMLPCNNSLAVELANAAAKTGLGGSDGHTLFSIGLAYTEVTAARTRQEFIEGLRLNQSRVGGEHGSYWKVTRDIWEVAQGMMKECPVTALLLPLATVIPIVSFGHYLREVKFARNWRWVVQNRERSRRGISASRPLGSEGVAS